MPDSSERPGCLNTPIYILVPHTLGPRPHSQRMTFQRGWRVCLDPLLCCSARVWAPNSMLGEIVSYPQESQSLVGFGKREAPRSRRGRKNQLTNKLLFCKTPCHGFAKGKAHGFTSQMQEPKSSVLVCELGQSQEASISLTFHLRKSGWMLFQSQGRHQYLSGYQGGCQRYLPTSPRRPPGDQGSRVKE